jgi:cob(I)alamin adenosyltransferase
MVRLKKGYVQIYTGNGKGKTTAALGQALRSAGNGLRTVIVQFMKDYKYGELRSIRELNEWIRLEQFGNDAFVLSKQPPRDLDLEAARKAFEHAREAMLSGKYDIVIMDEVCVAMYFGLLRKEKVIALIEEKPDCIELILTGRYCSSELIERADLVTEMREIKHYYHKGVLARKGIDV